MSLGWDEASARVSAPGSMFEIVEDEQGNRRYKHAPSNLRGLFDIARLGGDEIFLVYEDERLSFNDFFARVDALGDALVNHFGIARGRTEVQVHAIGPFQLTYVHPEDDPRIRS